MLIAYSRLREIGTSAGVIIPNFIRKALKIEVKDDLEVIYLSKGDVVTIEDDGAVLIKPMKKDCKK